MKGIFAYRPRQTQAEVSKLFTDHFESLIQSGIEFDESNLRKYWAEAERTAI